MSRNTRRAVAMAKQLELTQQETMGLVASQVRPREVMSATGLASKGKTMRLTTGEMFPGMKRGKYEVRNDRDNKVCGHVHRTFWSALNCMLKLTASDWKVINLKQERKKCTKP